MDPVAAMPGGEVSIEGCSGLVLTGGTDVDPALYGQTPVPETEEPDTARDAMERTLLTEALELEVPVLAICRGLQFLNVYCGGTLSQHIEGHQVRSDDRSVPVHTVQVLEGSLLSRIAPPTVAVNSRHHQAVEAIGQGLCITASAPDGVIEAMEMPDKRWVLAVQWHPEDQPDHQFLFDAFANAL